MQVSPSALSLSKLAFYWGTDVAQRSERVKQWVEALGLQPHPEGGYFKEVYRSHETLPADCLPQRFDSARSVATSIYYLLEENDFSALHRIRSDEIWHFHDGEALSVEALSPAGERHTWTLGLDLEQNQQPMAVVPAGYWFGARLAESTGFALVGCTVAPGFDFADFEMADRADLERRFGEHAAWIQGLTR